VLDDFFDDAGVRAAFGAHLGFSARRCGDAGWLFERRRLGMRRVEIAPIGFYTRLDGGRDAAALQALIDAAPAPLTRVRINLNPLEPQAAALARHALSRGYQVHRQETHLLHLAPTIAEMRQRYHATKRNQVAKANALASNIVLASTAAHMDDYHAAYRASLQRWGREQAVYPPSFLDALAACAPVRVWMNYVAGRLACSMVVLYSRRYALYWQGVSQIAPDQKAAFPMVRLMDAVLEDLSRTGIPCLNLGASEGLPAVRRFKEEFGAQACAYGALVHEGMAWRALQRARASLDFPGLRAGLPWRRGG
jgi:hypothetical protein